MYECGLLKGCCTWVNLAVKPGGDTDDGEETEEKDEDPVETEPEAGPPLLTPLSQDAGQFLKPMLTHMILTMVCMLELDCFSNPSL